MLDRDQLQYAYEDFRTRPDRVRAAKYAGAALAAVVLVLLAVVLSRGMGKPIKKKTRIKVEPVAAPASPTMRDAFAYAKGLEAKARGEERFAKVYFVPSAATASQKYGKVMVMGEVVSEGDFAALQRLLQQGGVPMTLEWDVTYPGMNDR